MGSKFCHRLSILIFAFSLLIGCGGSNTSDAEYLQQAKTAISDGDNTTATIQLKSALQANPENSEARYLLGLMHAENGYWLNAESELRKALELGYATSEVTTPLARALYEQWKFRALLKDIAPTDDMSASIRAAVHSYRSQAYLALGESTNAEVEAAMAEELDPNLSYTRIAAARLMLFRGETEKARHLLQAIVTTEPDNAVAWSLIGGIEQSKGSTSEAESAYSNAISSSGALATDQLKRALVRISVEDFEGAESDLIISAKKAPKFPGTLFAQGLLKFRQQNYTEAQADFEKTLSAAPNYTSVMFYLGATHLALNNLVQAEQYLAEFVRKVPESREGRKLLAATYNKQSNPEGTLKLLEQELKEPGDDIEAVLLLAAAYMLQNDASSAVSLYQLAVDLNFGDRGQIWMTLGMVQIYAGDEPTGIETLKSVTEAPYDDRAARTLAYYYFNTDRLDDALDTVALLEQKYPDRIALLYFKAQIYLKQGELKKARTSLEKTLVLDPDFTVANLTLAQLDIQDGMIDAAKDRYQTILKGDKNSIPAMMGLAELAQLARDDTQQLKWLQQAAEVSTTALVPRASLISYYLTRKENRNALSVAQKFANDMPNSPRALTLLGEVQVRTGDRQGAIGTYGRINQLAPNAPTYLSLAKAHSSLGDTKKAQTALQHALKLEPQNTTVINSLATLEAALGNHQEALRLALLYQQILPGSIMGVVLEGDALMSAKRYEDATKVYQKSLAMRADGRLAIKLHQAEQRSKDITSADQSLLSWLKKHPEDTAATNYLAISYMRRGLPKQAIEQYERLQSNGNSNAQVLNNLANLYLSTGDTRALDTARAAQKLEPDALMITDTLGWVLVNQGQVSDGLKYIEKAANGTSNNPEVQYHLAFALAESGQASEARTALREMPDSLPKSLEGPVQQLQNRLAKD